MNHPIFPRIFMDTSTRALLIVLAILIAVGGMVHDQFLSPRYLLLQLQSGALLGIIAAGAMLVILVGHIDLSVPWTLGISAIVSTAVMQAGAGSAWAELSPLAGLLAGAAIGVLNGFGIAYLRIPSLIWTLAINAILLGASAFYAGNAVVASQPSHLMTMLGSGKLFNVVPNSVLLWVFFSAGLMWLLRRTVIGRYIYLVGSREKAAYLSGIDTRRVVMGAFVLSGLCSAIAGMLLAGYSGQAYQRMGDPYLLPGIAAVVVGGTSILGGKGTYGGTIAGVLVITLISSMLSLMHVPEAIKQICYGVLIVGMVCLYSVRQTTATA
ncbi:ABC transporter permease [Paraburkholderia dipogonis]|uniref:ABC transporter permease n=1 Tax=Paraburkholderia dipogonis TaxID=1211383 RepID=UPI0038B89E35